MTGPDSIWARTYSRQPHGYWTDHRVMLAGERAGTLLLQLSDFADVNRTDGVIADAQLTLFGSARGRSTALQRLADVGLLTRLDIPPGWQITGWLDGHRSQAQWTKLAADRRKAGQKGGRSKPAQPKAPTEDPTPDPTPDASNDEPNAKQLASPLLNGAAAQHSSTQRSEDAAATAAGSRGHAVAAATATVLDRLGLGVAEVAGFGLPEAIERAMVLGWTVEGMAAKAAAARTKQHPLSWFTAAMEKGSDRTAMESF